MNRTQHNRNLGAQRDCSGWRVRAHAGFTLVEQLVIIAIMVLVSIVMVRGVPAAYSAFNNAVDAANAQLLLSTAATRLRDELSVADPTPQDPTRAPKGTTGDTLAQFDSMETGFQVTLVKGDDGSVAIERQAVDPSVFGAVVSSANATTDPLIATKADAGARSKELQVKVDSIEYDSSTGVFTVNNLRVVRKGSDEPLAPPKGDENRIDLKVRVLGNLS